MSAVPPPGLVQPDAWFVVCSSRDLQRRPLARTLQGRPLVLFRDAQQSPVALLDRCPHRNIPLSMGTVRQGELQCAYHGWRFDASGACTHVPGLMTQTPGLKSRCVERHEAREQDGFIWVAATAGRTPSHDPFRFPHLEDRRYTSVRRTFVAHCSLHAALENTLDVPHTAFLHGGLFRTEVKRNVLDVEVRRSARQAEAQFTGEPAPRGLVGWLLAPGGGVVEHVDRFLLPSIAQVEYRLGARSHLIASTAFTPVTDDETHVHTVVTFTLPVPGWLVKPFVAPVAARIFAQDRVVLRRQREQVKRFGGEKYVSTELDVLGPQMTVLLTRTAQGLEVEPHTHRLQLRT